MFTLTLPGKKILHKRSTLIGEHPGCNSGLGVKRVVGISRIPPFGV